MQKKSYPDPFAPPLILITTIPGTTLPSFGLPQHTTVAYLQSFSRLVPIHFQLACIVRSRLNQAEMTTSSNASTRLSETTTELFRLWCHSCWQQDDNDDDTRLQKEACSFFASLKDTTEVKIQDGTVLRTKGSHEAALAVLIQGMHPIWSGTRGDHAAHQVPGLLARRRALLCLKGALEGCSSAKLTDQNPLSTSLVRSLGNFLVQIAGPVVVQEEGEEEEDPDSDLDEQLRDTALSTLQVVLEAPLSPDDVAAALGLRLELALTAVQRRCAVPDLVDDEPPRPMGRVRSGLATLPRSRRSLCFTVLQAAVVSSSVDLQSAVFSMDIVKEAASFVQFAASCLHGESDPRCLLQLLKLLNSLQKSLLPIFRTKASPHVFPASEIFDAVSPYYPIQFTPPPNDVHGITKEGLTAALWNVLAFADYDKELVEAGYDTMVSLSLGLVMDTLEPPPEDGPVTAEEQLHSLKDLHSLLLGFPLEEVDTEVSVSNRILLLEATTLRHVNDTVWSIHGQAARKMDTEVSQRLVHHCRTYLSRLAWLVEQATNARTRSSSALYDVVVTSRLGSLSEDNPNDLAYLACLASSGGVQCLQKSLEMGLSPRVERLGRIDPAEASSVCDSIAVMIAACRAGCHRMLQRGVTLTPHPLQPYALSCLKVLQGILQEIPSVGAARAIESLLTAAPYQVWEDSMPETQIPDILNLFLKPILMTPSVVAVDEDVKWCECCAQSIPQLLALSREDMSLSILAQEPIRSAVDGVLSQLIESTVVVGSNGRRFDREALGRACFLSDSIAQQSTTGLLKRLTAASSSQGKVAACVVASLSCVLEEGGIKPSREIQRITEGVTLVDLVHTLSKYGGNEDAGMETGFGTSVLQLPPTEKDFKSFESQISNLYRIVLPIIPDYSKVVVNSHRKEVLSSLEKLLPPLKQSDTLKLSLLLPFAAKLLQNTKEFSRDEEVLWISARSYLADFALGDDPPEARKYAAEALHGILTRIDLQNTNCPVTPLMKDVVLQSMKSALSEALNRVRLKRDADREISRAAHLVAFMGLLGSASALRGGVSSRTADDITLFLMDLASQSEASLADSASDTVTLSALPESAAVLSISAAEAFGSILMAGASSAIWKQRLGYFALKRIKTISTPTRPPSVGLVLVVSYLVCSMDLKSQSQDVLALLVQIMLGGLKSIDAGASVPNSSEDSHAMPGSVKKTTLAALVKMQYICQEAIEPSLYAATTGVLRAYATTSSDDSTEDIVCFKVLALQFLEAVATQPISRDAVGRLKHAVIAIVGSTLNEKTSILRHASVDVLNSWHVV